MRLPREVWWVAGLTLLMFLLILLLTGGRPARPGEEQGRLGPALRTTYSSDPAGLRALYLTLRELGYDARRLRTLLLAPSLPRAGSLVVVEPMGMARAEWRAVRKWVGEGHVLLLVAEHALPGAEPVPREEEPDIASIFEEPKLSYARACQPSFLGQGVEQLAIRSQQRISPPAAAERPKPGAGGEDEQLPHRVPTEMENDLRAAAPLFRDERGAVVAYAGLGKGSVILLSSPWSLSNEGIARGDNLTLVLNALGPPGAGPVLFDEYHHGYGANPWWQLLPLPIKLAAAQLLLGLLVVMYARSRRFGRAVPLDRAGRQRSEFLGTMTALLQRGQAARLALRTASDAARERLRVELGLPQEAGSRELAQAAGRVSQAAAEKLAEALGQCEAALEAPGRLAEARALSLVQQLDAAVRDLHRIP